MTGTTSAWRSRLERLLTLEDGGDRAWLVLGLVLLTIVSPFIPLPGSLPAVRPEQVVLLVLVVPFLAFLRRHPAQRAVGIVDLGFLALTASTILTLALAPIIVPGISRSLRDIFEVAWIAQYWLIYRLARTLEFSDDQTIRLVRLLAWSSVVLAIFAVLQFLDPPGFNNLVTAIWTEAHNLLGVEREGRAVGTSGNANQFGILSAFFLCTGLAALTRDWSGRETWLLRAMVAGSAIGLGLTQSRGALLAAAAALGIGLLLLLGRREAIRGLRRGLPPIVVGGILVIALLMLAPPDSGSVVRRFDLTALLRDPSLVIRLGRLQTLVDTVDTNPLPTVGGDPAACLAGLLVPAPPAGHEPGPAAPAMAAGSMPADVRALATAVAHHYCATGSWPTGDLATQLVPNEIAAIPTDPTTGAPYDTYVSERGFAVGPDAVRSEANGQPSGASTAEAPGLGSLPNLIANPSFEDGGSAPTGWLYTPNTALSRVADGGAAFGSAMADARIPKGGAVFQYLVADLPMSTAYTAGVWVRGTTADTVTVQAYVVAIAASGHRTDPIAQASAAIPGDGSWHHVFVGLTTPNEHLTSLQVLIRAPEAPIHVDLDGATLTEGPVARAFGSVVDVAPSASVGGPSFGESPILGIGPQKDAAVAAYDNEYASFLAHYGILGLASYVLLFVTALAAGLRVARTRTPWGGLAGVTLATWTVALGVFAISAGAFRQVQVMVLFWTVVGLGVAAHRDRARRDSTA